MAVDTVLSLQIKIQSALSNALGQMRQADQTASQKECQVTIGDKGLQVAVPTDVCPGKLLKLLAEGAGIEDSQISPVFVKNGGRNVNVTLAFVMTNAHLGCKGIPGGRPTNLKMLSLVLATIAQQTLVTVGDLAE